MLPCESVLRHLCGSVMPALCHGCCVSWWLPLNAHTWDSNMGQHIFVSFSLGISVRSCFNVVPDDTSDCRCSSCITNVIV